MSHNITHETDHYEIGAGQRMEIGAGQRMEIGDSPSIEEDGFPQDVSLGGPSIPEDGFPQDVSLGTHPGTHLGTHEGTHLGAGDRLEIGAEETAAAVRQVIRTARDARQPPPRMRAVDADAPLQEDVVAEWFADIAVGYGQMIGVENPFPRMTKLLTRFGAGQEKPRYVRVDTAESHPHFLAENSPEMAEMKARLLDLSEKLERHIRDPLAHEDLIDAIDETEAIGAEVSEIEKSKEIELWLPPWAKGKIRAWREGGWICASMNLPGADGELRICTSMTPVVRAIEEMERHAAAANVQASAVVGVIPAMGCVLGAGTLVKEMAAAAPSILRRPEAAKREPFVVRIEPKANPAICAFVALLCECKRGDKVACAEWDALASAAGKNAPYVTQAMQEAKEIFLKMKKG